MVRTAVTKDSVSVCAGRKEERTRACRHMAGNLSCSRVMWVACSCIFNALCTSVRL